MLLSHDENDDESIRKDVILSYNLGLMRAFRIRFDLRPHYRSTPIQRATFYKFLGW